MDVAMADEVGCPRALGDKSRRAALRRKTTSVIRQLRRRYRISHFASQPVALGPSSLQRTPSSVALSLPPSLILSLPPSLVLSLPPSVSVILPYPEWSADDDDGKMVEDWVKSADPALAAVPLLAPPVIALVC